MKKSILPSNKKVILHIGGLYLHLVKITGGQSVSYCFRFEKFINIF